MLKNTNSRSSRIYQITCQIGLALLFLAMTGCSKRYSDLPVYSPIPIKEYQNESVGRFKTSYLAEQIDHYYRGTNPGPIGVTTLVNLDDLYSTSSFGRMYSEQLMSELAMRGFDVVELRHSDALQFLLSSGEFALSRDIASVRRARELGGVVVGTYVVSPVRVYVNARLIDPSTSLILAAGSVEMSKTEEMTKLLRGGAFATTLERIPVKHLGYSTYPLALFPSHGPKPYDWEEDAGDASSNAHWSKQPEGPKFWQAPPPQAHEEHSKKASSKATADIGGIKVQIGEKGEEKEEK